MPSPIGHGLAAAIVMHADAWLEDRARQKGGQARSTLGGRATLVAALVAANAADLDFLAGFAFGDPETFHRGATHSLGAAAIFGFILYMGARVWGWPRRDSLGLGMLSATAYTTHVVLDLFASDRYQWGLPLFWPLNDQAYLIPLPLFLSIRREADVTLFLPSLLQPHNVAAMIWEAVFMGAALLAVRRLFALPRPSSVTPAGETTEGAP